MQRRFAAVFFGEAEPLLPYGAQSFQGYRLLHEYFAMPEQFLFVELGGLSPALRHYTRTMRSMFSSSSTRSIAVLEHRVDASLFSLFCTPAVNLFPRRSDRIQVDRGGDSHIQPDRRAAAATTNPTR